MEYSTTHFNGDDRPKGLSRASPINNNYDNKEGEETTFVFQLVEQEDRNNIGRRVSGVGKGDAFCCCCKSTNNIDTLLGGSGKRKMKLISASFILFIVVLTATIVPCALFFVNDDDSGASASSSSATSPIRVGAFNVRRFGKSFMKKDGVVSGLVKILQRYDIVLVQEVRDSSETSLHDLKNKLVAADGVNWDFVVSEPLGRSVHYKEQYAYFYKPSSVKVIRSYQVADSAQDVYEREPFAVDIEYRSVSQSDSSNHRVVLLGIHAKPKDVEAELRELSKTVKSVASVFPDAQAVVSLGDFNADCSYLSRTAQRGLEIFSSPDFVSLIPDDADSTVSRNTDCAYDRVVVYYRPNGKCSCDRRVFDVKGGSVFNFENFLNIEEDEARKISDHYPVEFFLY